MRGHEPIGLWLVPLLCAIGFAVAFWRLAARGMFEASGPRLALVSAEVGVGNALVFWLVIAWLGLGAGGANIFAMLWTVVLPSVIWAVAAWPFTMWRLERRLGLPYHRSYDVTTGLCAPMLLCFFVVAAAGLVIAYL